MPIDKDIRRGLHLGGSIMGLYSSTYFQTLKMIVFRSQR